MKDRATVDLSCCSRNGAADSLDTLVELVVQRLSLSQDVAAAKYVSGQPIDDPIRERDVLDSVARALNGTGAAQETGMQFFRDQIEANKVVQRGLHQRWHAHPEEVPDLDRSLAAHVRPKLDVITTRMLRQFLYINELPNLRRGYIEDLLDKQLIAKAARQLPRLHRNAAVFALRSLCGE
jgi:chorismate mutase